MDLAFTIPAPALRRCVERVAKIVEKRSTIPILANILIEASENGRVSVSGTDLDIIAVATTTSQVATDVTPGKITIPAGLFLDVLKKAKDTVTLRTEQEGMVALSVGRTNYRLRSLPAEDWPDIKTIQPTSRFEITKEQLDRIPACVSFAISTEETRYYLGGIFFRAMPKDDGGHHLAAVATDGHRLSRLFLPDIEVEEAMPGIIVPRKMISLFSTLTASVDAGDMIAVAVSDQRISFETDELRIDSMLIDGTFPDYDRVIPQNNHRKATVPRIALSEAADRVLTISSERGRAIAFAFDGDENLALKCRSADAGEAQDSVLVDGSFDAIELGFNGRYLLEILATFKADSLQFAMADPGSPTVITDPGDETRLVVLMPMRV